MKLRNLAGGALVFSIIASPALAAGTIHVALQLKPGLWEFTDTPKVSGDTLFPEAMLANIPPPQRVQFLTDMRKRMAEPRRARECISQAKFEQRLFSNAGNCTRTVALNTASAIDIRTTCRSERQGTRQSTDNKVVASGPTMVTSSFHAVTVRGGKTMTIDTTEIGRWLSAGCPLKDNEIQQMP